MPNIIKKSFDSPDKTSSPAEKMKVDFIEIGDLKIQKVTAEPGWQWSKHLKPVVGGESCQVNHRIYLISGKLASRTDDGMEEELGPGDVGFIPAGHDGWVVGDEKAVWLEVLL